jgi:predicted acetyltransferase
MRRVGHENVLLARRGGKIVGGLYLLAFGQWFGGRSVPSMGIAAVGVAPEERGSGAAKALMTAALEETRRRGIPLSTLYPTTHTLYRRCGYELAGDYCAITLEPAGAPAGDRSLNVRPLTDADLPVMENIYRQLAREHNGWIDRGTASWQRILSPREGAPRSRLVLDGDTPEGYIHYRIERHDAHAQTMHILDMAAITPAAIRRLLAFIADHRSLVKQAIWHGPANDPMFMYLPERSYTAGIERTWMLRIMDVAAALAQRGYPPGASGEAHFEISDEVLPTNKGRYVLSVSDGTGCVENGGKGSVKCDVRGLATLYTGYMTPDQLVRAEKLSCQPRDLPALTTLFAGSPPSMVDLF